MVSPNAFAPFVQSRRVLAASLVGTAIEFYDFYIYATAASLVIGPLFFPAAEPSLRLLAAYASFGIAFLARPLGAVVFGHYGDRIGRKSTLVASLMTMGASTVLIGFLPTYATLGWPAPALLCLLRFGQGFGLGGEWGGAALLAVENAPRGWRARFGMFPQLGAPVGFVAANGFFLVLGVALGPEAFAAWGWRLPFLSSVLLVSVGLWVRLRLAETPVFARSLAEAPPPPVPLAEVLREHPRAVLTGTLAVVACFALFYISTAFALGYATGTLHHTGRAVLLVQIAAVPGLAIGIVAAGAWSDVVGPRRVLVVGCLATMAVGALLGPMLGGSLALEWAVLTLALTTMGFVYGPLGAYLPSLLPARVRYTGVSMAFNLGGILGGGLAPFIALELAQRGGLALVGAYLAGAAAVSLVAIQAMPAGAPEPP